MLDEKITYEDMIPGARDNSRMRDSLMKDRVCIKPYLREDTTTIVPNSVDEDLNLGAEKFLTLQQDRKWANHQNHHLLFKILHR
jgi:hypothetical protein